MPDERENKPSASDMFRIVGCAGYLQLREKVGPLPPRRDHDSDLGVLTHEVLRNEGRGIENLPTDKARWVVDEALHIRDKFVRELFGDQPVRIVKEERFWMQDTNGHRIFSSMLDFMAIDQERALALIVDYKSLYGDTDDAESNWQLLSQAACAVEQLKRDGLALKGVYATIVQPNITTSPSLVKYGEQQLTDIGLLVRRKLRESRHKNASRTPGNHCKYCPVAGYCPEAQSMAIVLYHTNALDRVEQMTSTEIARLLPVFPVVNKVMERVRARAEELAAAGELEGYVMKDGYSLTEITDIPGFYEAMKTECGITRDEFFRNLSATKEGLETIFRDRYSASTGNSKKKASERFKELVAEYGEKRQTKARLVAVKEKAQIT